MPQPPVGNDNPTPPADHERKPPWWLIAIVSPLAVALVIALATGLLDGVFGGEGEPQPPPGPKDLRVLVAIDTSGSMNKRVSPSGRRITNATDGALAALDQLESPYELGLWTFRDMGPRESVRIAPDTQDEDGVAHISEIRRKLRLLPARQSNDGGTPLYNTISEGIRQLEDEAQSDVRDTVSALIILTDSDDNPPDELKANGEAVTEVEIDSLLRKVEDRIQVIVTAAYETPCSDLEQRVPALRGHCITVRDGLAVKPTLRTILRRLEAARVKQDSP